MKNRFKEITIMNAFLCLCVIMIHITSAPLAELTVGTFWHIAIFCVNKVLCFCVPAFIFLSGFKLHNKYKDTKIDLKRFYLGRLKTIVIPYVISVLVYFLYFFSKKWVMLSELPEYIFLGTLAAHFYYIVIAVQFYLLFPLLMRLFEKFPKTFGAVSIICTVVCLEFFTFTYSDRFMGTYIFYFALGMIFSRYKLYEKEKKLYITAAVAAAAIAAVHLYLMYRITSVAFFYRYAGVVNLAYVTLAIIAIYGICIKLSEKYSCNFSKSISGVSYNIYLYHILALSILQYDVFVNYTLSVRNEFIITFFVIYGLTFIYAIIAKKLKKGV